MMMMMMNSMNQEWWLWCSLHVTPTFDMQTLETYPRDPFFRIFWFSSYAFWPTEEVRWFSFRSLRDPRAMIGSQGVATVFQCFAWKDLMRLVKITVLQRGLIRNLHFCWRVASLTRWTRIIFPSRMKGIYSVVEPLNLKRYVRSSNWSKFPQTFRG